MIVDLIPVEIIAISRGFLIFTYIKQLGMETIIFDKSKHNYNKITKTISISEKEVAFATRYRVLSPTTRNEVEFVFSHATGPEFDPNTKWVYESAIGVTLEVCNDPELTKILADNYLKAKLR